MEDFDAVKQRFSRISGALNERLRRLFAATEAEVLGYGGVSLVARATGVSRRAITEGLAELSIGVSYVPEKTPEWIRRPGGGRKKAVVLDATLQVIWKASSNRSLLGIQSPRCGGLVNACASSPGNSPRSGIRSATP